MASTLFLVVLTLWQTFGCFNNVANGQTNFNFTIIMNNYNNVATVMTNTRTALNLTQLALLGCLGQALSGTALVPTFVANNNTTRLTKSSGSPVGRDSEQQVAARALVPLEQSAESNGRQARLDLNPLIASCASGLLGLVQELVALVLALLAAVVLLVESLLAGLLGTPLLSRLLAPLQMTLQQLSTILVSPLRSSTGTLNTQAAAVSQCLRDLVAPFTTGATLPAQPVTLAQCQASLNALGTTLMSLSGTLNGAMPSMQAAAGQISQLQSGFFLPTH